MVGFIFGSKDKDKPWTYEELQRKREIAESLAAGNMRTPQNVGEGLASIGRALMYRKLDKKASAEESRMRDEFNAKWGSVLGGLGGGGGAYASTSGGAPSGTWTPAAPAPGPVEQVTQGMDVAKSGGLSFAGQPKADPGMIGGGKEPLDFGAAVMTPQEMLIEGAKRRGLDPIDVATAISYETGGKFDPTIKGPTTQWGTHEGLIQFGDPQGEKYGADFSNPDAAWRSQLNPDSGAVWRYLEDTGVKSGMGLPEIYSAINAGAVGRMGASDANNGGAPGTVADKVAGMAPHRENAAAFLGGTWTPNPDAGGNVTMSAKGAPSGGGLDIGALIALGGDPMASPQQQAIVSALLQQEMQKMDPAYQMQLEKQQLELAQLKDPTSDPLDAIKLKQAELDYQQDQSGAGGSVPAGFATLDMQARAAGFAPGTPEYQEFMKNGGTSGAPAAFIALDLQAKAAGYEPGTPEYQRFMASRGAYERGLDTAVGKAEGEDAALFESMKSKMPGLEKVVEELGQVADEATYTGAGQAANWIGKQLGFEPTDAAVARTKYIAMVDNQVLPMLRDTFGAAFTVAEGDSLRATLGDPDKTPEEKQVVLQSFIEQKKRDLEALGARVGNKAEPDASGASGAPVSISSDAEYDALPSGATFVGPDGKTRRKP